jgi:heme exporter protein A
MLTCSNISAVRNKKLLFSGLGFTIFNGSCLFIRGRNGIGKTSLLKIIANLIPKSSGDIFYNSINIKLALREFYQLIFYIGKTDVLDESLTVLKNLEFWGELYDQEMNIPASIKTFDLEPYINTKLYKLSQGLKQRVLLSRLLLCSAKIWLLDEPFNSLDYQGRDILVNLIKARCMQRGIVIIVDHDQNIKIENMSEINLQDFCNDQ